MKIFQKIFIGIILILTIYIIINDIDYLKNKVSSLFLKKNEINLINNFGDKIQLLPAKIITPGALEIINSLWTNDKIILSNNNIINITNQFRKENNIENILQENNKLNLSAQKKLEDMFINQYFEHESPNGISISDIGDMVNYEYILIGENLAMGNFKDDLSLVKAWMDSPGHRANILNNNYHEIGVATTKGMYKGKEIWMAVTHFGTSKEYCPHIDKVLFGLITINQNQINEMEADFKIRLDRINRGILYKGKTQNEQIRIYNDLVNYYNNLLVETKKKIESYNQQVKLFNTCLIELTE
jgi:hypothetical protein